jgi:hypothetical protein
MSVKRAFDHGQRHNGRPSMRTTLKFSAITLLAMLCSVCASAQTHLEPEEAGILSGGFDNHDYDSLRRTVFKEAFEPDTRALALIEEPMAGSDAAVGIKEDKGVFRIFGLRSKTWLWLHTEAGKAQAKEYNLDVPPISIDRCDVGIDPALGQQLLEAWKQMLLRTQYDASPHWGADGAWFLFSMPLGQQRLAGRTWSPMSGSPRLFVDITGNMEELCTTKERVYVDRLRQQVRGLLAQLK